MATNYTQFRKQQHALKSADGVIKYIDQGKGAVILLLHGVPTSSWLYRKMINELAMNYRVIAPDMLGFGSSDSPPGYDIYEPVEHAKRLLGLMDSLEIKNWTHVFHDAGGLWTWELIKAASSRISNLIILNTIIYKEGFNPPIKLKKGLLTKFIMMLYRNGISTDSMLKGLFNGGLMENNLTKEELQGYKKPLIEGKTKSLYHFFSKTCQELPNYEDVIKNIDIPKLLIWGKHDSFLVFDKMKEKAIHDLQLEKSNIHMLDAKHFIQEEKPQIINRLILDFLKSQTSSVKSTNY